MAMTRLLFFCAALLLFDTGIAAADDALAVIVHPSRRVALDRDEIERIYLKKRRYWDDGAAIIPINREGGSAIRAQFTTLLFGVRGQHLNEYWNRRYFQGILPPITLLSDEAVKRYVARDPNAIGYISADAVDSSVRSVLVLRQPSAPEPR